MVRMFETVLSRFFIPGTIVNVEPYGRGLINDTYRCHVDDSGTPRSYILQRLNPAVFAHPDEVMANVQIVSSHILLKVRAQGVAHPESVHPVLVPTRSGETFYRDKDGSLWRVFHFIESGLVFDTVQHKRHAREVGRALGKFHAFAADLNPATLSITVPDFHHTPRYLAEYEKAKNDDTKGRAGGVQHEHEFVIQRRALASVLADMVASGSLPVRVLHNDPKVNNVMFSATTHEALCMIDLDTVMPGTVAVDFGDCIRSAANPAGESPDDPATAVLDLELVEAITDGYLREAGSFLTPAEIAALPGAIKVITFELGLRFLADYLRGDTYFKVDSPTENLHRARVQFRLVESIEQNERRVTEIVQRLAASSRRFF